MQLQTTVGPVTVATSLPNGATPNARSGQLGDAIVSELHGRYYEQAYRNALFAAANQAAQATTVALATTYTGLCLTNPIGTKFNVVINKVGIALTVAPAAIAAIGVMTGYNSTTSVTQTTPITPRAQLFGVGQAGVALTASSVTLPTAPVLNTVLMGGFTAAALPGVGPALIDLEGSIILPPGAYAAIYTLTSVTGLFSFGWEEVPL